MPPDMTTEALTKMEDLEAEIRKKAADAIERVTDAATSTKHDIQNFIDTAIAERRALLDAMKLDVATLLQRSAVVIVRDFRATTMNKSPAPIEFRAEMLGYGTAEHRLTEFLGTLPKSGKYRAMLIITPQEN